MVPVHKTGHILKMCKDKVAHGKSCVFFSLNEFLLILEPAGFGKAQKLLEDILDVSKIKSLFVTTFP